MKSSHIILIVFVVAAVAFVFYSMQGGQSDEDYAKVIQKEREDKDHFMKTSSASPFADSVGNYTELNYFPANQKYRLNADLEEIESKKVLILPTSDGKSTRYLEYAHAVFKLDGTENKILILEVMEEGPERGKLFLSFADATSGNETYGAGRYLDIKKVPGSTAITLDFNLAYNPYCAYSDRFSCPFPPKENVLRVAIPVGEKSYHK
jgi:uncharacterized protein (DUF1684 family)